MVSSWKSQFIYEIMWMCFVLHMNIRETKRTPYWIKNVARKNKCETKEVNNKGVNNQLEAKKLKSEWHIYSDREPLSDSVGVYFVVCIIYERCMSWSVQTQPISNLFIWTTSSSLIKLYSGFKMNVPTLCGWCGSLFVDVFVAVWLVTFFFSPPFNSYLLWMNGNYITWAVLLAKRLNSKINKFTGNVEYFHAVVIALAYVQCENYLA